jgi:hypothetical protein
MASTSCALRKRVEDVEIFCVLEESTDSDVTIFLYKEDEDGNEPDSDEDGQFLGKMASYLFRQFFQLHKSYENAIGTRNIQLWHYKGKKKNWPTEFRKPNVLKLKRSESRKMQHEDVTAVVWQDKRTMFMIMFS